MRSLLPVAAAAQATASGFTRAARVSGLRSTDKVVTWAPGTASPGPSRQRLHKKARGLASGRDAAAPQPSDAATRATKRRNISDVELAQVEARPAGEAMPSWRKRRPGMPPVLSLVPHIKSILGTKVLISCLRNSFPSGRNLVFLFFCRAAQQQTATQNAQLTTIPTCDVPGTR